MRAVLIGADLMYRQDGKLVPIEINTNAAWDSVNRVEDNLDDIFDLATFEAFLSEHEIEEIWVDGLIASYLEKYYSEKGLNIKTKSNRELEEAEDRPGLLLLRTSYSDEALVDSFCRDKDLFLKAIESFDFGCEFILKTAEGFEGNITSFVDNGDYPNFIVKYRYPNYDQSIYPKLVKLTSSEELQAFLESEEMEEDCLIMPFYYNGDQLWEQESEKRMKVIRHLSMFALVDGALEAVPVATYTKLCGNIINVHCQYSELGVLDSDSRKKFLVYWTETGRGDVLAERGDLVLMADDTWKPVEELAVGEEIKALDMPTNGGVDIKHHVEDYNISFEELQESSSYSVNRVTSISQIESIVTKVNLKFTDGTDWWDTADSSYPTIDPTDGTVWFRTLDMLEVGDKVILLDATDLENPVYVEKEIEETERKREAVRGYQLTLDGSHLFLTRESSEAGAYVSIEHNKQVQCTYSNMDYSCYAYLNYTCADSGKSYLSGTCNSKNTRNISFSMDGVSSGVVIQCAYANIQGWLMDVSSGNTWMAVEYSLTQPMWVGGTCASKTISIQDCTTCTACTGCREGYWLVTVQSLYGSGWNQARLVMNVALDSTNCSSSTCNSRDSGWQSQGASFTVGVAKSNYGCRITGLFWQVR